MLKAVLTL